MTLKKQCDGVGCTEVQRNLPVSIVARVRGKEHVWHACSAVCMDDLVDRAFPEQAVPVESPAAPAPIAAVPSPSQLPSRPVSSVPVLAPRSPATFGRPS